MSKKYRSRDVKEAELDEELEIHIQMETEKNLAAGMAPDAARKAAVARFGGVAVVKEEVRDSWGARFWDSLKGDVRIGARSLIRSRGFTLIVILTLALGIGTNTAIFSVVNGVLLQPLPYASGERLVRLHQSAPAAKLDDIAFSPKEFADYRDGVTALDGIAEYHSMQFHLIGKGEPRRVQTGVVSANFFDVLGVRPLLGRNFARGEDALGSQPVLLLSYGFWMRAFGGETSIVGQSLEMNDKPHIVIGVLPPIPLYPDENDVYMPTSACPFRSSPDVVGDRRARMSLAFGRLAEGSSIYTAKAQLASVASRMVADNPKDYSDRTSMSASAIPVRAELTEGGRTRLLLLLAVAGFVLLIVCANVANLTLARGLKREHEMAVRSALGADRLRLLRQLMTEGLLVALVGGAVGLIGAVWAKDLLVDFAARFSPRAQEIRIDLAVAVFTFVVSIMTGLVFAAIPALPSTIDLAGSLRDDGSRSSGSLRRARLRSILVVAQVAFSVVLLIGAGLMLKSLVRLQNVDPGFHAENVLTMRLDLDWAQIRKIEGTKAQTAASISAYQRLLDGVRAVPGVTDASFATAVPLAQTFPFAGQFDLEGKKAPTPEQRPTTDFRVATPGYFATIGLPLLQGRTFTDDDKLDGRQVGIVNRTFVKRFLGSEEPIGKRMTFDEGETWVNIIGVVGDTRDKGLDTEAHDMVYVPMSQNGTFEASLLVRTAGDPQALAKDVREAIRAVDPRQPIADLRTFNAVRDTALASPRLTTLLLGLFAIFALVITATGVGGVIALTVTQRTREIAVRMALGANRREVLSMILRQALGLVVVGLVVGAAGAFALGHLMTSLLYDVTPTDPITYVLVTLLVIAVATFACWAPARRAAGIDPMVALRAG